MKLHVFKLLVPDNLANVQQDYLVLSQMCYGIICNPHSRILIGILNISRKLLAHFITSAITSPLFYFISFATVSPVPRAIRLHHRHQKIRHFYIFNPPVRCTLAWNKADVRNPGFFVIN